VQSCEPVFGRGSISWQLSSCQPLTGYRECRSMLGAATTKSTDVLATGPDPVCGPGPMQVFGPG
jgi:hypothetical protein